MGLPPFILVHFGASDPCAKNEEVILLVERTYILFVVWEKQKKNLFFLKNKSIHELAIVVFGAFCELRSNAQDVPKKMHVQTMRITHTVSNEQ